MTELRNHQAHNYWQGRRSHHVIPGDADQFYGRKVDGILEAPVPTAVSLGDGTPSPSFTADVTVSITPADSDTGTDGHQVDLVRDANTITVTVSKTGQITRNSTVTLSWLWAGIESVALTSDPVWDDAYAAGDEIEMTVTFNNRWPLPPPSSRRW